MTMVVSGCGLGNAAISAGARVSNSRSRRSSMYRCSKPGGGRQYHQAAGLWDGLRLRQHEVTTLTALGNQAQAIPAPPQNLDAISGTAPKHDRLTGERILGQLRLDDRGEPIKPLRMSVAPTAKIPLLLLSLMPYSNRHAHSRDIVTACRVSASSGRRCWRLLRHSPLARIPAARRLLRLPHPHRRTRPHPQCLRALWL
jgi:hypothetical protein